MTMPVRLAIIEDDAPLRRIFTSWVRRAPDFQLVSEYPDAEAAVTALEADRPDVVLVDINLPGMDGVECVRRLSALAPNAQIVMLTVYDNTEAIFNSLAAGASATTPRRVAWSRPRRAALTRRRW